MAILALFLVCMASPINEWRGDTDSGATCVQYRKAHPTVASCIQDLKRVEEEMSTPEEQERLAMRFPGPYSYTGECRVSVTEGYFVSSGK